LVDRLEVPAGQVPGLDQALPAASGDRVQGRPAAGHAAADDQHVELLRGQPSQGLGPAGRDSTARRQALVIGVRRPVPESWAGG
jgi:hypothetical protein